MEQRLTIKESVKIRIATLIMIIPMIVLGPEEGCEVAFNIGVISFIGAVIVLEIRELATIITKENKEKGEERTGTVIQRRFNLINLKEECQGWNGSDSGWIA